MSNAHVNRKTVRLVQMAILVAIIFLLMFTPLGFLVIGPIAATTIQMPVIIGAILLGPTSGAILGGFFGLSAIIKVIIMPGADAFATAVLTYNFFGYLVIAMVPRILMGWFAGLLGTALQKNKKDVLTYGVTGFVGSMLNTIFYLGALWMIAAQVIANAYQIDLSGVGAVVMTTAITAGVPEAIISSIVVTAVCKALKKVIG